MQTEIFAVFFSTPISIFREQKISRENKENFENRLVPRYFSLKQTWLKSLIVQDGRFFTLTVLMSNERNYAHFHEQ